MNQAIERERPWMDHHSVTGMNTFTFTPTDNLMSPIHLRMYFIWIGVEPGAPRGKSTKAS